MTYPLLGCSIYLLEGDFFFGSIKLAKDKNLGIPKSQIEEDFPGIECDWIEERDLEAQWMKTYNEVLEFVKENKKLPPDDSSYGRWCSTQRTVFKGKSRGILNERRVDLLEKLPYNVWFWDYNNKASAEQHREWIQLEKCGRVQWENEIWKKYKNQGALSHACSKFNKDWNWFTGIPDKASAEQHREWIQKEKCSCEKWRKKIHKKYLDQGAVVDPRKTFNLPAKWFIREIKSLKEHVEKIRELGCETLSQYRFLYKKFSLNENDFILDVKKYFKKDDEYFTGIKKIQPTFEKYINWMVEEKCYRYYSWKKYWKKYRDLGATILPHRQLNISEKTFQDKLDKELGNKHASVDQHREWISKERCTINEWRTIIYKKYSHLGSHCMPEKLYNKKPSWFTGNKEQCRSRIVNLDTGEIFDSVPEAANKTGIGRSGIANVLCGRAKTAGGYRWEKIEVEDE